jgi:hypothetical protein
MPYNTNWKDENPIIEKFKYKKTSNPLKKKGSYMVTKKPWCHIYRLPHSQDHCIVAQTILEEDFFLKMERNIIQFI